MEVDEEADAGDEVVPPGGSAGKVNVVVGDDDVGGQEGDEAGEGDEVGSQPGWQVVCGDV